MIQAMTIIKKVYEEELKPMGYVKTKSKYPYYVKMLTPEIFATISIEKEKNFSMRFKGNVGQLMTGYGEFRVYCGIGTVYRREIDFDRDVEDNEYWLSDIKEIYYNDNIDSYGKGYPDELYFYYKQDDKESIIDIAKRSIDVIREYAFDKFEKIDSLEKVIKYFEKYHFSLLYMGEDHEPGFDYCEVLDEGIVNILINNHDNYSDLYNHEREKYFYMANSPITGLTMEDHERFCKLLAEEINGMISSRDKVFDDSEIYENVLRELEIRKNKNTGILKSFGITL